ncbi:VOC family protein [Sphingobium sp. CR2-8]|uniref:VOC family protein n=1 Tax=Sphingobium sp. CR2-8 TaxID=1306534 RepID=UPI002DBFA2C0|nr:VOC family protein [Sphingobium sp. CR2-8]MEC3911879.1 VOC family protein [Sphingobium sp. CR2-8]
MTHPAPVSLRRANPGLTPLMLSHAAWVTHDVETTADFYMRIMGMELASTVMGESIPSTGDDFPYFHIFFRMADGSTIAFFEAPGLPPRPPVSHAAYELFDHVALQAANHEEVDRWRDWLVANDLEVIGPTDHDGLIYSIYFHDPNGLRLEITTPTDPDWNKHTEKGKSDLALWCEGKKAAANVGEDISAAMIKVIQQNSRRGK